ncbi:3-dehydroquinate synthase [Anaerolentibacter hominis]|uniref:3-dehydroquinate synthase n=1 Tax=Anaerolentibacter hominis TaxID=3079009 RepID=UPI0031B84343
MSKTITIHYKEAPIYDITIEKDFHALAESLKGLELKTCKVCIIADSNVAKQYAGEAGKTLLPAVSEVNTFVFPAGEESKNLNTVMDAYEFLIQHKYDRNDVIIALGGGVTGDLAGFTASTYLRGVRVVQIPTSLLAMVDSSIGGKTGVDFNAYKNMVGAFHQPKAVYMNLSALLTLSEKQFNSGFAEVIKHGLLEDAPLYNWMKENRAALMDRDLSALEEMIHRSCLDKKRIVEVDPLEKAERALLNLGHTLGHSIEKLMDFKLLHGECVSIGTVAAAYLSMRRGMITENALEDIIETFRNYKLPVSISGLKPADILAVSKSDKKMEAGHIKFILLKQVGRAVMMKDITDQELLAAIDFISVP